MLEVQFWTSRSLTIKRIACVCVYTPSWIIHGPVFSLHALPQVPFVCLPKLELPSLTS